MVKNNKSTLIKILSGTVILAGILLTVGIVGINKRDAARLKGYEDAALAVGVTRARQECLSEGLQAEVCQGITGVVSATECNGRTCWIVYARSDDPHGYGASITVNRQNGNGNYTVIDYLRDTGTRR